MRHGYKIDLRKIGLSREEWHKLRLEAKALGVPVSVLAYVAIGEWLREKRRMLEVKIGKKLARLDFLEPNLESHKCL
jgi:hypothetical protein